MGVAFRRGVMASVALSSLAVPFYRRAATPTVPYNSEEHQLIVDLGVEGVTVPPTVTFPTGVGFNTANDYYRPAKLLAVGFDSNDTTQFNPEKKAQDNCFFTAKSQYIPIVDATVDIPFHQAAYNKKIYVPPHTADMPRNALQVLAHNGVASYGAFTIGQLAALYGDYRKTTWCDASGKCYLTNGDVGVVRFSKASNVLPFNKTKYCPDSVHAGVYLRYVSSGVVPPFGGLANATANSADDDEYSEAGWWGDEMLRIANINEWHFNNAAVAWYVGLHRLALLYADSARTDSKHWIRALHYEANALHSLSDLFAFGHVVTSRDESSFSYTRGFTARRSYRWMQNVLHVGGGSRSNAAGRIALDDSLPAIADVASERNDFWPSYTGTDWKKSDYERRFHDFFNATGAQVRNFNGDDFRIFGDGQLKAILNGPGAGVIKNAVKASVQSLLDAHVELQTNKRTVEQIGAAGSTYFGALKYLPVFIVSDNAGHFKGQWTRYAAAIAGIAGVTRADLDKCVAPYVSGAIEFNKLGKQATPCTQF